MVRQSIDEVRPLLSLMTPTITSARRNTLPAVQGDTLTWMSESKLGGNPVKMRFTAKEVSPTMYRMKLEIGSDGGWTVVMEGRAINSAQQDNV